MEAGKLRHRITIKQKTVTRDSFGGEKITWTTVCTVWGEASSLSGNEAVRFGLEEAVGLEKIRIRYRSGSLPKMQAVYDGRSFDILGAQNIMERKREIWLACREIVD